MHPASFTGSAQNQWRRGATHGGKHAAIAEQGARVRCVHNYIHCFEHLPPRGAPMEMSSFTSSWRCHEPDPCCLIGFEFLRGQLLSCAYCGDCLNTLLKELGIGAPRLDFVKIWLSFPFFKKKKKKATDKDMSHPSVTGPGVTAKVCQVYILVYSHSNTILLSHCFIQ